MASLRMTAIVPESVGMDEQRAALADLARRLRADLHEGQRLRRIHGLSLPGAPAKDTSHRGSGPDEDKPTPDRVFMLELSDGDPALAMLRALGGWLMGHPQMGVALKADGPGGGVSLRLDHWSAVAFASAVARVQQHLQPPSTDEAG